MDLTNGALPRRKLGHRNCTAGGVAMDVRIGRFIGTLNNDPEAKKQLNQQVGIGNGYLELRVATY